MPGFITCMYGLWSEPILEWNTCINVAIQNQSKVAVDLAINNE